MGIKGLAKLIASKAPSARKNVDIVKYFGKVIAVDASVVLYQFLTSARDHSSALLNVNGQDTSHILGVLYRTVMMLEKGIKPIFVFDGKPPKEKEDELKRRSETKTKVEAEIHQAKLNGDTKLVEALSKRTVRVTEQHVKSCKDLLGYLGVPYIDAAGEAEAQCAALVKNGHAFAVATEDMDALTFGSNILIRNFNANKDTIRQTEEFHLDTLFEKLGIDNNQFVDLCILLGCDYCDTIKGLGPERSLAFIKKYKTIENILKSVESKKFNVTDKFDYVNARRLFHSPPISDVSNMKFEWNSPNLDDTLKFLTQENNFSITRVQNVIERLKKLQNVSNQSRLDFFFTPKCKRSSIESDSTEKQKKV